MSPPPEDTIDLLINGKEILTAKSYEVTRAFFQVPDTFSMVIGSGKTSLDLMRQVPPGSLFALRINGVVQFVGYTDGFERLGGGATEVTVSGRDALAQLVRAQIENDRSFNNITLEGLAQEAIKGAGILESTLFFDAAAQRAAVTGTPQVTEEKTSKTIVSSAVGGGLQPPELRLVSTGEQEGTPFAYDLVPVRSGVTTVETTQTKVTKRVTGFKADKPIKWDAGESYLTALKKDCDRAGVFLRAGTDPDGLDPNVFLLSAPDGDQAAKFWLLNTRREDVPDNAVLVLPPQIRYVMTGRHSKYVVHGQAGGGKDGRRPIEGVYHDNEAEEGLPLPATRVIKDPNCKSIHQANYRARKECAAERRANRSFVYVIPHRHTMPLIENPAQRGIIAPDTVVHVRDDEFGINGPMWVERVKFSKSVTGGTFTEVTLLDPGDLIFGDDEPTKPLGARAPKKRHRRSK